MPLPSATWPMARQLRELLATWRDQGATFEGAWPRALALLVRDPEWREVLEEHREVWRLAFERRPGPKDLASLVALVPEAPGFERPGGEEDGARLCAWCHQPIRRLDPRARYCGVEHRRAAERALAHARRRSSRTAREDPPTAEGSCAQTLTAPMEALR